LRNGKPKHEINASACRELRPEEDAPKDKNKDRHLKHCMLYVNNNEMIAAVEEKVKSKCGT